MNKSLFQSLRGGRASLPPMRILVTGARGKSSVTRLLTAALEACGAAPAGRITGVLPRELFKGRERLILRAGPGSVGEMKWWLGSLPYEAGSVVLENSAVAPDLQLLAWRWLKPSCTVLTNVRPDHEDAWGKGEEAAAGVLCSGIGGGPVFLPESAAGGMAAALLSARGCELRTCPDGKNFRETHLSLVRGVCEFLGLDEGKALGAASALAPDVADFQIFDEGEGRLACAFSANDPASAIDLFAETGWRSQETTALFNSRKDRTFRLASFKSFLCGLNWKRVAVSGSRPLFLPPGVEWVSIKRAEDLKTFVSFEGAVFGCGNVAGVPLEYLLQKRLRPEGGKRI